MPLSFFCSIYVLHAAVQPTFNFSFATLPFIINKFLISDFTETTFHNRILQCKNPFRAIETIPYNCTSCRFYRSLVNLRRQEIYSLKYVRKTSKISRYSNDHKPKIWFTWNSQMDFYYYAFSYLFIYLFIQRDGHRIYKDLKAYINAVRGLLT